jgi:abscisic-aldehyde oxidase
LYFETYRASPRPLGNALPYVNAAFLVEMSSSEDSGGSMVDSCRLSFGAFGNKHSIRAKNVEEFLTGKLLSVSILYEAVNLLTATIVPKDKNSKTAYCSSLAAGFVFQFFNPLIEIYDGATNSYLNGYSNSLSVNGFKFKENQKQVHHDKIPTLLSSGKQVLEAGNKYHPIGEPIIKSGAALQATGLFCVIYI